MSAEASALERFYARLARRLHPWRAGIWLVGLAACVGFAYVTLASAGELDVSLMALSVAVALWAVGLLTLIHGFVDPPPLGEGAGFLARVRRRLLRLGRLLLAWLMTALALVVLVVSLRALMLALKGLSG